MEWFHVTREQITAVAARSLDPPASPHLPLTQIFDAHSL